MKKYEWYFGNHFFRIIFFAICGILIAFGGYQLVLSNYVGGCFFAAIGGIPAIIFADIMITDKKMDAIVDETKNNYLSKHIADKSVGRIKLDPADFSV